MDMSIKNAERVELNAKIVRTAKMCKMLHII